MCNVNCALYIWTWQWYTQSFDFSLPCHTTCKLIIWTCTNKINGKTRFEKCVFFLSYYLWAMLHMLLWKSRNKANSEIITTIMKGRKYSNTTLSWNFLQQASICACIVHHKIMYNHKQGEKRNKINVFFSYNSAQTHNILFGSLYFCSFLSLLFCCFSCSW